MIKEKHFWPNHRLYQHKRVKHEGIRYKCLECDALFTELSGFSRHSKKFHKNGAKSEKTKIEIEASASISQNCDSNDSAYKLEIDKVWYLYYQAVLIKNTIKISPILSHEN